MNIPWTHPVDNVESRFHRTKPQWVALFLAWGVQPGKSCFSPSNLWIAGSSFPCNQWYKKNPGFSLHGAMKVAKVDIWIFPKSYTPNSSKRFGDVQKNYSYWGNDPHDYGNPHDWGRSSNGWVHWSSRNCQCSSSWGVSIVSSMGKWHISVPARGGYPHEIPHSCCPHGISMKPHWFLVKSTLSWDVPLMSG